MIDLPTIWFVVIGVLVVGYAVLDGFDLGVGILSPIVGRTPAERGVLIASIGPFWDGNEVWLVAFGGALFAAFPLVYATVFSGFYLALMLLLFALILRAVAMEFRHQMASARWQRVWDGAFFFGSFLAALLLGVAIGNIARGLPLHDGYYTDGLLGLLNPFSLCVGLLTLAMFAMQGAAWLTLRTSGDLERRARRAGRVSWVAFIAVWLVVTAYALLEAPHLWTNYSNPLTWIAPICFIAAVGLTGAALSRPSGRRTIVASSLSIVALIAMLGQSLFPALVPNSAGGASLTIANSSSSDLSLSVMLMIVLLGMPVVLIYTALVYRRFTGKVDVAEVNYGSSG